MICYPSDDAQDILVVEIAGGGDASAGSQIFYDAFHAKFGHGSGGAITFTLFACISLFFGNITNVTLTARMVLLSLCPPWQPLHTQNCSSHGSSSSLSANCDEGDDILTL